MAIPPDNDPDQERKERVPPKTGSIKGKKEKLRFRPALLATNEGDFNTIHFTTWVEVRVVNDNRVPLADEKCVLWSADGLKREGKTDANGVVRFDGLPFLDVDASTADLTRPAFQLLDILEEWPAQTIGNFPKPEDYRRMDRKVRFVPTETPSFEICIDQLTEEQKFQHFYHQYTDHNARYWVSSPDNFESGNKRWKWGRGAVCNQHVNFLLGYWFNYNTKFTTRGSATFTTCLPNYTSAIHKFKIGTETTRHRGYLEFVNSLSAGEALSDYPCPEPEHCSTIYRSVQWARISEYFDKQTLEPKGDLGKIFFDMLSNFNMYSLSDIRKGTANETHAVAAVRKWLKKHKAENGYTDQQINHMSKDAIWDIVWDLGAEPWSDDELIETLRNYVTWDHHGGLLLKRAADGGEPTGTGDKLWTFSADGKDSSSSGPLIVLKKFSDGDLKRHMMHLNIWCLKTLRPGGYAPADAEDNEGQISIEEPSRFLMWS